MAKGYTKRPPNFRLLVFWRALVRREHVEKSDKSFTFTEEFARSGDHWRLRLVHSACCQGLRARAGDHHLSSMTTRFSDCIEWHHRTHKAEYSRRRLKDLVERSAIIAATKTAVMRHEEAKVGEGGPN
jgi:hypothetical protein